VRVRLVPHVPHDLVARRVEQAVHGDRDLARPQVRAEVPPDLAHRVDEQLAHLLREALQLVLGQAVQVLRAVDAVEERLGHDERV
jgi:hypothetical protein